MSGGRTPVSRRRFVSLAAAAAAAAVTAPALAAPAPRKRPAAKPAAPPDPHHKEFERQRAQVEGALKAIRDFKLPPGGDLPVVFRPLRTRGTHRGSGGSAARRGGSGSGGGR